MLGPATVEADVPAAEVGVVPFVTPLLLAGLDKVDVDAIVLLEDVACLLPLPLAGPLSEIELEAFLFFWPGM